MDVTHVFAGIAVSDIAMARGWYEKLFGRQPDMLPHDDEAVWRAGGFGSVYVTADPERAGRGLLTLAVKDLARVRTDLERCGLAPIEGAEANGLPTLTVTDPDGNRIKVFQDPGDD